MNKETPDKKTLLLAYAGLAFAVFSWAVNTVIARGIIYEIQPLALSFFRWFSALIIIFPFALPYLKKDFSWIISNLKHLFILSVFSVAVYNSVLYIGARHTTATNIALIGASMPAITILLAWIINNEKPGMLQICGAIISLAGMITIIAKGSFLSLLNFEFNPGDILIILSITSWALYSVLLRKKTINIHPISLLTTLIFMGSLCILPFYVWEYKNFSGFDLNMSTFLIFLFLAIFPSILSYISWNFGVKVVGSGRASLFMYLLPVFTSVLAFLFLGESIAVYHISGGIIILTGLIMSSY
ncbi:MAG: DMT family transporter [Desulfobacterales bacterium]|nr:DMT family transporter [Desulfobacterales bacterium]